jgi:hypothetical protein
MRFFWVPNECVLRILLSSQSSWSIFLVQLTVTIKQLFRVLGFLAAAAAAVA